MAELVFRRGYRSGRRAALREDLNALGPDDQGDGCGRPVKDKADHRSFRRSGRRITPGKCTSERPVIIDRGIARFTGAQSDCIDEALEKSDGPDGESLT